MEKMCEHAGIIQENSDIICMVYSQCKRADGRIWAHYPICSNENCPIKHPELLEGAILKTDHTMGYKEAARRIKEHMRVHDQKEPYKTDESAGYGVPHFLCKLTGNYFTHPCELTRDDRRCPYLKEVSEGAESCGG